METLSFNEANPVIMRFYEHVDLIILAHYVFIACLTTLSVAQ
jgi:hypothetical protein